MYGEHVLAALDRAAAAALRQLPLVRRTRGRERGRCGDPHLSPHRDRRNGAEGAGAAAAERTVLYVSPIITTLQTALWPWWSVLNAVGNGLLA